MAQNFDKDEFSADEIVRWFFEHYESPDAAGVPYDSEEKEYVYFFGGPYEAEDEIYSEFPSIDYETLQSALSQIEGNSFEWVNKEEWADGERRNRREINREIDEEERNNEGDFTKRIDTKKY